MLAADLLDSSSLLKGMKGLALLQYYWIMFVWKGTEVRAGRSIIIKSEVIKIKFASVQVLKSYIKEKRTYEP